MISPANSAFGAPGIDPRWTSSAKEGIGTAYSSSSNLWFTLSHGIVNEIYFPTVDLPNTRDLQFLITDGETFLHEEKRDLRHEIAYPEQDALLYRLTNTAFDGRYRLVKEIIGEPHSSVLLMRTRVEIDDATLRGKLKLYALLSPHLNGTGRHNTARLLAVGGRSLLHASRDDIHLVLGCSSDFSRRSVGYVGASDGWRDLQENFQMDWMFERAEEGNVALLGEIRLPENGEFTLGVAFAFSAQSAATKLLQAFGRPFDPLCEKYVAQWQRTRLDPTLSTHTGDGGVLARLSQCVLRAHEDKLFPGAFVASLSIPWGETKDDRDRGGYHLVWTRDMVHTATALLAVGLKESALRALIWLAAVQGSDGGLPQNSTISGEPYWKGIQLDEVAAPILLAWRLRRENALGDYDAWTVVSRAAGYLIRHGPVTGQERWEENSGYSPSTLAAMIAALVCASEFAEERGQPGDAKFLLEYADWLSAHVEGWTVTHCGELMAGRPRHYIRITPADADCGFAAADPDGAHLEIANGGGSHLARNVVSGDFLQLVRMGVRSADDPVILDSIAVLDFVLKRELPAGPAWRRYNHDGYGQQSDGSAFDGVGVGRSWPLLTGERGHYEIAAGGDPAPFVKAMEGFANAGGMLPEQVWDEPERPSAGMYKGKPTGSAMPLCWAHAEYLQLVRSKKDGACFDQAEPVRARYASRPTVSPLEVWSFAHQLPRIGQGKLLRIVASAAGTLHFSCDNWVTVKDRELQPTDFDCWYADVAPVELGNGPGAVFTFRWADRWEGRDYRVALG